MSSKRYTIGEEIFNSITHGIGALCSIIGATVMITLAAAFGNFPAIISSVIFGISLVLLYTMSTLYHAFPFEKVKKIFRVLDHAAIPILIAGSYTPFCLVLLSENIKATYTIIFIWIICASCITLNFINLEKFEKLALILYILMGWSVLILLPDIISSISQGGLILLTLGGLSYTIGIIFYKIKIKYFHGIWHLFVVAGSVLHYLCVVIYVLPLTY